MKLGLLTDIHEHVDYLAAALQMLQQEAVDQIVVIGDIYETGKQLDEACQLLTEADAIGVWGNHDFGLCVNPIPEVREKFHLTTLAFMSRLTPWLDIGDCHFSHVEPWLDATELVDIWYFKGEPDRPESLERIFDAVPQRLMFSGHNHRWLLATRESVCDWKGEGPVDLSNQRYFVVIGALCDGNFATLDTASWTLTPRRVDLESTPRSV